MSLARITRSIERAYWDHYHKVSNIRSTWVGNKIVDHSHVVGAAPTTYIFILNLTPGFNGLGKGNCKTRRETFMFGDWVPRILENWRHIRVPHVHWQACTSMIVADVLAPNCCQAISKNHTDSTVLWHGSYYATYVDVLLVVNPNFRDPAWISNCSHTFLCMSLLIHAGIQAKLC